MGTIAIGDVHGCAETLAALLRRLDPQPDDHLVFVGDYIDRGPDARRVVDVLLELREHHTCTFLRGNHEALLLAYLDGERVNGYDASEVWSANGGLQTLGSYLDGGAVRIPQSHIDFYRSTRLYADHDDFFFVHAGLRPRLTVAENVAAADEEVFLWERSHLKASRLAWEKPVVCGHTPHVEPINRDKLIMIDTGCVYHLHPGMGRLCAVRLPERVFEFEPYRE